MNCFQRLIFIACAFFSLFAYPGEPADLVNPFIGTTNYGTTNPGPVLPNGMMSVSPFNVMGSNKNKFDKDKQWWSTPYSNVNRFLTGFSHVNLSGVGCPEAGSLLLMATSGDLNVNYTEYGSEYTSETATPGYYSNILTKYNIKAEVSATSRSSIARFTFPEGEANIILNLGEGLTNESGAWMRRVSDTEVEGMKLLGSFCYNPQAVFPIYFVMRVNKNPKAAGYWKMQREMGVEAQWDETSGKRKLYTRYDRDIAGDDIGAFFMYDMTGGESVEVQIGVSFVSTKNARLNLETEQPGFDFEKVKRDARKAWNDALSKVIPEGGSKDQQVIFYTSLYHALIHPNVLNDVNGEYPEMEGNEIRKTDSARYTVFSLWDTYRNVHQLLTLLYPEKQLNMVRSIVNMYKEGGWLPRWELYSRETLTMEGDPAIPVLVDSWMKGLRDFDVEAAYNAMYKSAATPGKDNFIRPDIDDYIARGYIPLREEFDNSVSHALEYYIADNALSKFAKALGKDDDANRFYSQSLNYRKYYSTEFGVFRPILPDGEFLSPFNPKQGENFEPVHGFHEGSSWNYSFMVPHDVEGLIKMHGGKRKFVKKLQEVFDDGHYDPTNEPNISYPYLFSYLKGEEWRTQVITRELLAKHFKNSPDGLPGNDDTGTMSAWAVFTMMGLYPDNATDPSYTFTTPVFDKLTITLDAYRYNSHTIEIESVRPSDKAILIDRIEVDGKRWKNHRITHDELVKAKRIVFYLKERR
ncbi:GH92 family glycosyl hydrolase [Proteiniphilum propionicum]|uniref:GH92 family glycosyl hydrolase n=1 Tax=Proteiniphilum propionicum TaxID=2829812 RepID=UPI001EECA8D7|nr:GH92 family glycosyl hydrolase [Proteiniphilum propionicum]ULB35122.1 GH92 family glycosyl hydrolase [Proteiniphilum propionicum]